MRHFSIYFYENFDADSLTGFNPRAVLRQPPDAALSFVLERAPGACGYQELCGRFSEERAAELVRAGVFCIQNDSVLLGCTVITAEDLPVLKQGFWGGAAHMAEILHAHRAEFIALAEKVKNGFSPAENLYHILCARIFDGEFFEFLSKKGVVATSKLQPCGLDYILTVYEDTPELRQFSDRLLCSYNRFSDGRRALLSFGDADGDRKDFYRFARQKELGNVPPGLEELEKAWDLAAPFKKEDLLNSAEELVLHGSCREEHRRLLESFDYVRGKKVIVPVFLKEDLAAAKEMEQLVERLLFKEMKQLLTASAAGELTCARHGVPAAELANELYHIVFGLLNEAIVNCGLAARPQHFPQEGRYRKAIELF